MKKTDWGILLLTIAFSFLFYKENAGINCLLFSLVAIGFFVWDDPTRTKNLNWLIVAAACLCSSFFIFLHSSTLSVLAFYCSLLLLSAYSINSKASVLTNLFYGYYSILSSFIFVAVNTYTSLIQKKEGDKKTKGMRTLTYLIPFVLALIFFFIYKNANPLFKEYTKWINLDFISIHWLIFTLWGFLVAYGLVRHQRIQGLDNWEKNLSIDIDKNETQSSRWNEKKSVLILFVLLNTMLLFINCLDINYLYLGAGLPKDLTHKQFVHDGVGMLICSIVLGISIILFFLRGGLNFGKENKSVRVLIYIWLFQNLMMVISTAIRNHIYIMDALLTYKRIGVFYWLLMAAVGLTVTGYKLKKTKSSWFLIRSNALFAFIVLVLSSSVDWDRLIGDFNIKRVPNIAGLDKRYLISISETNLAQLYRLKDDKDFNTDSSYHYAMYKRSKNSTALDRKLFYFMDELLNCSWKSFCVRKKRVLREIIALNSAEKIQSLDLTSTYFSSFEPLFPLTNLRKIQLGASNNPTKKWLSELKQFKKLDTLALTSLDASHIEYLSALKNLKCISLTYTNKSVIDSLKAKMYGVQIIDKGNSSY